MKEVLRSLAALILSLSLVSAPMAYAEQGTAAPSEIKVTPNALIKAAAARESSYSEKLSAKFAKFNSMTEPIGTVGKYVDEVLQVQALLIMMAASSAQAAHEHSEMNRLSGKADAPTGAPEGACDAKSQSAIGTVFCSGDFFLGVLGGAAGMGLNHAGTAIFSRILKNAGGPLVSVIGAMLSNSLMMAGSTSAAFLWSESVKLLPKAEMIERARGVAGRAGLAFAEGHWSEFQASEDGAIFLQILANMNKIIHADPSIASHWIYNMWRFGVARGEFITNMTAIMAASTGGELVAGAVGATAVGAVTLGAPVIGFIVTCALGYFAMELIFRTGASDFFTRDIQALRQFYEKGQMRVDRDYISSLTVAFNQNRYPRAAEPDYVEKYSKWFDQYITAENKARSYWANVMIEKFYELLLKEKILETKIAAAEVAIKDADLQKQLYFDVDGEILSFQQAHEKICHDSNTSCSVDMSYQLKALDDLKPQFQGAEKALVPLAKSLVEEYEVDSRTAGQYGCNTDLLFPPPITEQLVSFRDKAQALADNFRLILAGTNSEVAKELDVPMDTTKDPATGASEEDKFATFARREISIYYTQSFDEDKVYDGIKDVQDQTRLATIFSCVMTNLGSGGH